MKNILGVVLCGGESKRMGSDKGLIEINGQTWAVEIAGKILSHQIPVVVSINQQQEELYNKLFSREQLIVDNIDIHGPLKGLLTVHLKYPQQDILLMACDLIDMDNLTLENLIKQYNAHQSFDFFVYHQDFSEPFCAIYTARGLKPILAKAQGQSLDKYSFQSILQEGNTLRIPITNKSAFRNYNTVPSHHK